MENVEHIYVDGGALFFPPGHPAIPAVKKALRFQNPDYAQMMRMREKGRNVPLPSQWVYRCYVIPHGHKWAGGLMCPRHVDVEAMCPHLNLRRIDRTTFPEASPVFLADHIKLRDYQEEAVDMTSLGMGHIVAPTGSGKTTMGMAIASRYDTKALVLVHTKDLAKQWIERCEQQLRDEFGKPVKATLFGAGKKDDEGRIVVAIYQSVQSMPFLERYEWAKQFGLVITDECHRVPSETYNQTMCCMAARYRFGLTATPHRGDGFDIILAYQVGPMIKEVELEKLAEKGSVMVPVARFVETGWNPRRLFRVKFRKKAIDEKYGRRELNEREATEYRELMRSQFPGESITKMAQDDWSTLINQAARSEERNELIIEYAKKLLEDGRQVLILSDRVKHCYELAEALGDDAYPLVGEMKDKDREEVIRLAQEGVARVVTATSVADEGLDIPSLDSVILTMPSKAMNRIQQRVGRVMRTKEGKRTPLVIDFIDDSDSFKGLARKRARLYRKLGCSIAPLETRPARN